jgi:hypothetical protein
MDVLSRWGRLDKNQIAEHVGRVLDEDFQAESFNRAILRDLADLVKNHRIHVEYFTRDGALLDDYDADIHKNVFCQWFIPGSEGQVSGSGHIKSLNGYFYAPKLIRNDLSIISGNTQVDPRYRHLYFQIGSSFLCLKASFQAFPFGIILSRTHGSVGQAELDLIKRKFGIRACLLKVPFAKLSSFKNEEMPGHLFLEFLNESSIKLSDYNSTNGAYVYKLKMSEADKIRSSGAVLNDYTLTNTWKEIDLDFVKPIKINQNDTFDLPVLIEIGAEFKMLIV